MSHRLAAPTRASLFAAVAAFGALRAVAAGAQDLPTIEPLDASGRVTYFVDEGAAGSAYRDGDRELARWALEAWERSLGGRLHFEPAPQSAALIRVYFVPAAAGQYGEMRSLRVDEKVGAAVFIRPDTDALGPEIAELAAADPLLRDTIVYLTCVHELGHALGLAHTSNFDDIMYFFGYGGDIPRFFGRYRERLGSRADIAHVSGISAGDLAQLMARYGGRPLEARGQ